MIIRHDKDDRQYQDLGKRHAPSVAYISGCAGTLIHDDWILTAAHCVEGREGALFMVRHGDRDYRINAIAVHPKYRDGGSRQYDIALIQLQEPVENGRSAALYRHSDENGRKVVFVGRGTFGNGKEGLLHPDGKQRGATNSIIATSTHLITFRFDAPDTEAATELEGISGPGDSGGPALIIEDSRPYVAGVSSHQDENGYGKGRYGVSEFYTRVSANLAWIESTIEAAVAPALLEHPVIDAVKNNNPGQLEREACGDVLENAAIMSEALYHTVALDRVSLAEMLFERGVEVNSLVINGASLFECALFHQRGNYFDMLLERFRHSRHVHDESSRVVPLLISSRGDNTRVAEHIGILLDQGANVDVRTPEADTALILAGWLTSNVGLIRTLVERGADVNLANANGDTALIDAAYLGKNEILEFLLDNGADLKLRNRNGRSALDMANAGNNTDAIELLTSRRSPRR